VPVQGLVFAMLRHSDHCASTLQYPFNPMKEAAITVSMQE